MKKVLIDGKEVRGVSRVQFPKFDKKDLIVLEFRSLSDLLLSGASGNKNNVSLAQLNRNTGKKNDYTKVIALECTHGQDCLFAGKVRLHFIEIPDIRDGRANSISFRCYFKIE